MNKKSMTALVSAFSRAYHAKVSEIKVFDDYVAEKLFDKEEFVGIGKHIIQGIQFFNPNFSGSDEEALKWVINQQMAPTPIGRAAFAEKSLENAVLIGAKQYLIFGAGYDTFAYRQPDWAQEIKVFEIDHPATAEDKALRLENANIERPSNTYTLKADFTEKNWIEALRQEPELDKNEISFCSVLGLSYYLSEVVFKEFLKNITSVLATGSAIVFDYPDEKHGTDQAGERTRKQKAMADATGEKMLSNYSYGQMEALLAEVGLSIYEHLTPDEITESCFKDYNNYYTAEPIKAFDNVNYCLAVKR